MNNNDYLRINDFISDIGKHLEENTESFPEELEFLNEYTWINEDVLKGIVMISKEIRRNNKVNSMILSDKKIGRPKKLKQIKIAVKMYKDGIRPIKKILDESGIGRSTLYENIDILWDEV